jgi:hypothetical protein
MALLNHFYQPRAASFGVQDFLSEEPGRRSVELDFLQRLRDGLDAQSARVIEAAAKRPLDTFPAQYELMHGPLFDGLASAMARDIPEDEDFGPFRGGA